MSACRKWASSPEMKIGLAHTEVHRQPVEGVPAMVGLVVALAGKVAEGGEAQALRASFANVPGGAAARWSSRGSFSARRFCPRATSQGKPASRLVAGRTAIHIDAGRRLVA